MQENNKKWIDNLISNIFDAVNKSDDNCSFQDSIKIDSNVYIKSVKGLIRSINQDRLAFVKIRNHPATKSSLSICILADGMGGMKNGDAAASLAIASFLAYMSMSRERGLISLCKKAVGYANQRVYNDFFGKGGTTLSAMVFGKNGCVGVNIGDSRIYFINENDSIKQLTKDDTIEGQIIDSNSGIDNWINPYYEDSRLAQFVGMGEGIEPHVEDFTHYKKTDNDGYFLITSDGAHYIGNPMINKVVENCPDKVQLINRIVHISEWLSGHDNSSAILIHKDIRVEEEVKNEEYINIAIATICDKQVLLCPIIDWIELIDEDTVKVPRNGIIDDNNTEKDMKQKPKQKYATKRKEKNKNNKKENKKDEVPVQLEFIDSKGNANGKSS